MVSIHPLLTQWALNHRINLLPILMTAINAVSSAVYLKGFSMREKAQTYCLALIFLVLLYNSPSGLVLYWTLNNLFSLAKNVVQRWVKHPGLVAHGAISAVMLAAIGYMLAALDDQSPKKRLVVLAGVLVFTAAPYVMRAWKKGWLSDRRRRLYRNNPQLLSGLPSVFATPCAASFDKNVSRRPEVDTLLFLTSACGLALLCGLVLPSSVIATDVMEFSFVGGTDNPLYYVARSLCVFTGLFVLWPLVVYHMFGMKVKSALSLLFPFAPVMALLNVYAFCYDYGRMDVFFKLDNRYLLENYSAFYSVLPILAAILAAGVLYIAVKRNGSKHITAVLVVFCIAELSLSVIKVHSISADYKDCAAEHNKNKAISARGGIKSVYHLSRTGRNVVILFSDAAINSFFPYIVKQFPELKDKFSGFVYYPNTVSFGSGTIKAIDAMSGGYEYTPEAMDKRSDELVLDKYNEAASVMPKLFLDAGYSVTIGEPQDKYCVYNNDSYKRFDGVKAYYLENKLGTPYMIERGDTYKSLAGLPDAIIKKHILGFCFMQSVMPVLRETIYNDSWYYQTRFTNDHYVAVNRYAALYFLDSLTDTEAFGNTFTYIGSELTHNPALMEEPNYIPNNGIDASKAACGYYKWKISADDNENSDLTRYHVNAAAIKLYGAWFDYLKSQGVYDNTRIIIVADHGAHIPTPAFDGMEHGLDYANLNPLLLVKDFGATGEVRTDSTFMTNADTILLATEGLDVSGKNPFTGVRFSDVQDKSEVHIYFGNKDVMERQKTWNKAKGYAVHDNIFDESNWTPIGGKN